MLKRIVRAVRRDGVTLLAARRLERLLAPKGISPISFTREASLQSHIKSDDAKSQFELMALENTWGSPETLSGEGSELAYSAVYRRELVELIKSRGFRSMFDAPCGDMNWMPKVLEQVHIDYLGGDLVGTLVDANKAKHPGLRFTVFDITRDQFPAMDVWHCRDCLFHLSFANIRLALRNFVNSGCQHILLTTHKGFLKNVDVKDGGFRRLDFSRGPFNFGPAEVMLHDYRRGQDFPRYVGLWHRDRIAEFLESGNSGASTR
jgi:hypothetical protein